MAASNWAFVTAAYAVTWIMILGYLVLGQRALRRARAEYARITTPAPDRGARP